jgi:hypothetical protein
MSPIKDETCEAAVNRPAIDADIERGSIYVAQNKPPVK